MEAAGGGILQVASDFNSFTDIEGEFALLERVARQDEPPSFLADGAKPFQAGGLAGVARLHRESERGRRGRVRAGSSARHRHAFRARPVAAQPMSNAVENITKTGNLILIDSPS
jgi:hypothetical protein